jgi:hypothetical protein
MKKRIIIGTMIVATIVAVATINVSLNPQSKNLSALSLANLEALANEENGCHNTNGYRSWNTSGGLFGSKKEFYDCCSVLRQGYSPSGNCN